MNFFTTRKNHDSSEIEVGASQNFKLSVNGPAEDDRYMARALQLAAKGINTSHPNPAVGCVIVNNGNIVGEGWHQSAGGPHAEVNALKSAGSAARGATMYVTLEPCCHQGKTPPCTRAIIKSGINRVVTALEDPNPLVNRAGISALQQAGIDVLCGVGQKQAKRINRGFLKRVTTGIPWVTLKIATSLDGKTAMNSGESQWITGSAARHDAHRLRASSSAILTGVGTVLRDDPSMTARSEGVQRQPHRIILDTNLSTPPEANIFKGEGKVLLLTSVIDEELIPPYDTRKTEVIGFDEVSGRIDLHKVVKLLGKKEYNNILLEAGSRLSGSMLRAGLVDEIVVYMSPDLLGSDARDMFSIAGMQFLSDKIEFEFESIMAVGRDIKITLRPVSVN
jgi:diaminohydroxyphosphoribosylaminopyrimidine deaminase/5-amino-6-(5-phosphoribosylamino)uracil reductase